MVLNINDKLNTFFIIYIEGKYCFHSQVFIARYIESGKHVEFICF